MLDHVGIAVSDLAASERFYRAVLGALGIDTTYADPGLVEWEDLAIGPPDREHSVARGLQMAFRARDVDAVDAFRQAGTEAGAGDEDGALLDPDGHRVEAVVAEAEQMSDGWIDHLWLRVRDPQASRRFYATIAPYAGLRLADD